MKIPSRATLARVLGELLVIVVGVIVALQFENLRDRRSAREQEAAALASLRTDLRETLFRLDQDVRRHQSSLGAQSALLRMAGGVQEMAHADSMASLVGWAILFQRLEPVTGSYAALVNAGDLRLIQNDSLRASIAALFGKMGDGYEDEDLSTALRTEMIMAASAVADLRSLTGDFFSEVLDLPSSARSDQYAALLSEPRYMTALVGVSLAERFQMAYFAEIRRDIESVLAQIEQEMQHRSLR